MMVFLDVFVFLALQHIAAVLVFSHPGSGL